MPGMPRPSGKARKIAYSILGLPANMMKQPQKLRRIKERIVYEETRLVK